MNKILSLWIGFFLLWATPVLAEINVPGELSHVAGGALIAGVVTGTVADKYWPEHRGVIGFAASTALIVVGEGMQMIEGEEFSSSLLDVSAHTLGSLIGAVITDRYILTPVLTLDTAGNPKIGMVVQGSF